MPLVFLVDLPFEATHFTLKYNIIIHQSNEKCQWYLDLGESFIYSFICSSMIEYDEKTIPVLKGNLATEGYMSTQCCPTAVKAPRFKKLNNVRLKIQKGTAKSPLHKHLSHLQLCWRYIYLTCM